MPNLKEGDFVKIDYVKKSYGTIFCIATIHKNTQTADVYQISRSRSGIKEEIETTAIPVERLTKVCRETYWNGFDKFICGRAVKSDNMCGIHAGVAKRHAMKEAKHNAELIEFQERREARNAKHAATRKRVEALFGANSAIQVNEFNPEYVTLRIDQLEDIIRNA
jgi:hypothetical protein